MQGTEQNRENIIVKTSLIGVAGNILLAAFKAAVGILSNSIAITLDAVNNMSDALSSIITIVGTKLASKPADKKHPFGYGRIEYLSAMIIANIILYAGVTSFVESIRKIISPQSPDYSMPMLIILIVAVIVKIIMGLYVRKTGERVNSDSLIASGKDALTDSVISMTTIVAALVYMFTSFSLEAWLGVLISIVIIKAGLETLRDTISEILGERAADGLSRQIKDTISGIDGVRGVYDLVLNNYGPDRFVASVHIEVDDDANAVQIDKMQRRITKEVLEKNQVLLTAIGIYPANTSDTKAGEIKKKLLDYLKQYPEVLQMHGLYLDEDEQALYADIIIDFDAGNRRELFTAIKKDIGEMFPEYRTILQLDLDVSTI